jgi:D-serine deaminase-like pyridoxal phosphate-dependent protein
MKRLPRQAWRIKAAARAAAADASLRSRDLGAGGHDAYFAALQRALKSAGIAEPTLVIDKARLAANIETVRRALAPTPMALRVVSKSLQAPALLEAVLAGTGSDRLMVFNGVMLDEIAAFRPQADVLLGRPLPAAQVADFVARHANDPAPAAHPQWLVDSSRRLAQYLEIVRATNSPMRISLEIDVGLHRGGLPDERALAGVIDQARGVALIEITGLMGYDAHAAGAPSPAAEVARVKARYAAARAVLEEKLRPNPAGLTFNTAGSPTYALHLDDDIANEVSVGSAFVKPTHFDLPSLENHVAAAFIAQPVLKAVDPALIPRLEDLASDLETIDPNTRRGFFLYGGYGDARAVSPLGLRFSPLYGGRSMLTGSARVELAQDDFVFMRPTESEGVFLQFGDIAVYEGGEIVERWPTFKVAP